MLGIWGSHLIPLLKSHVQAPSHLLVLVWPIRSRVIPAGNLISSALHPPSSILSISLPHPATAQY